MGMRVAAENAQIEQWMPLARQVASQFACSDQDNLVGEAMLSLVRAWRNLGPHAEPCSGWLATVIRHDVISAIRAGRPRGYRTYPAALRPRLVGLFDGMPMTTREETECDRLLAYELVRHWLNAPEWVRWAVFRVHVAGEAAIRLVPSKRNASLRLYQSALALLRSQVHQTAPPRMVFVIPELSRAQRRRMTQQFKASYA